MMTSSDKVFENEPPCDACFLRHSHASSVSLTGANAVTDRCRHGMIQRPRRQSPPSVERVTSRARPTLCRPAERIATFEMTATYVGRASLYSSLPSPSTAERH